MSVFPCCSACGCDCPRGEDDAPPSLPFLLAEDEHASPLGPQVFPDPGLVVSAPVGAVVRTFLAEVELVLSALELGLQPIPAAANQGALRRPPEMRSSSSQAIFELLSC